MHVLKLLAIKAMSIFIEIHKISYLHKVRLISAPKNLHKFNFKNIQSTPTVSTSAKVLYFHPLWLATHVFAITSSLSGNWQGLLIHVNLWFRCEKTKARKGRAREKKNFFNLSSPNWIGERWWFDLINDLCQVRPSIELKFIIPRWLLRHRKPSLQISFSNKSSKLNWHLFLVLELQCNSKCKVN